MKLFDSFGNKRDNEIVNAFKRLDYDMHYSFYEEIVKLFLLFGWHQEIDDSDESDFKKNNIQIQAYCDYFAALFSYSGKTCTITPGKFWIDSQETTQIECFALLLNWMRL